MLHVFHWSLSGCDIEMQGLLSGRYFELHGLLSGFCYVQSFFFRGSVAIHFCLQLCFCFYNGHIFVCLSVFSCIYMPVVSIWWLQLLGF